MSNLGSLCCPPPTQAPGSRAVLAMSATFPWPTRAQLSVCPSITHRPSSKYPVTASALCHSILEPVFQDSADPVLFSGLLSSICRHGPQRAVLSAPHSKMACSSVFLVPKDTLYESQKQLVTLILLTTSKSDQDTYTEETVLRGQRRERERDSQAAQYPEVIEKQANQGRGRNGTRGAQNAFRPLGVQR